MAITLTRVDKETYQPDLAGIVLKVQLSNATHWFLKGEFTHRFYEAYTLLTMKFYRDGTYVFRDAFYGEINNGNLNQVFLSGYDLKEFIENFIFDIITDPQPIPDNTILPLTLPFILTA